MFGAEKHENASQQHSMSFADQDSEDKRPNNLENNSIIINSDTENNIDDKKLTAVKSYRNPL